MFAWELLLGLWMTFKGFEQTAVSRLLAEPTTELGGHDSIGAPIPV
jgi:hypothetical protein